MQSVVNTVECQRLKLLPRGEQSARATMVKVKLDTTRGTRKRNFPIPENPKFDFFILSSSIVLTPRQSWSLRFKFHVCFHPNTSSWFVNPKKVKPRKRKIQRLWLEIKLKLMGRWALSLCFSVLQKLKVIACHWLFI